MADKPETCKWESAKPYDCKPGLCVIINNEKFDGKIEDIDGEKDKSGLEEVFEKLGFDVVVFSDLKANEIRQNVSRYSFGNDIEDYKGKAFVLIILSHGGAGDVICGTDGGAVELHMLQECFYTESCESLAGVPKVFLIGACRGGTDEKGYSFLTKAGTNQESNETRTYITDSSDFITVFASTRGNRAFGYKEDGEMKGSFFTQILIKVIEEADENTEFNEIIREVRFRVQQAVEQVAIKAGQIPKEQAPGVKTVMTQTVQANSTLMRPYYIKRNETKKDEKASK